jgi:hypothetical protein
MEERTENAVAATGKNKRGFYTTGRGGLSIFLQKKGAFAPLGVSTRTGAKSQPNPAFPGWSSLI